MIHFIEAAMQVIIGSLLIFLANLVVFPLLGIEATVMANAYLVAINSLIAFAKSYFVRAIFRRWVR